MDDWRELKQMTKALADVARLTIIYHLARRDDITVTELTDLLAISQPLLSWHLRKLRKAGLVQTRRAGRQVYCTLNSARYQLWLNRMGRLIDPQLQLSQDALPSGEALMEADVGVEG